MRNRWNEIIKKANWDLNLDQPVCRENCIWAELAELREHPASQPPRESVQKVGVHPCRQRHSLIVEKYLKNSLFLYMKTRNLGRKDLGYFTVSSLPLSFLHSPLAVLYMPYVNCPVSLLDGNYFQWLKTLINLVIYKSCMFFRAFVEVRN